MKETFLTKNFLLMFAINTLICVGFYMIMPILPVYAVRDIGIDQGSVGFIIGVFAISSVIGRPICGYSVDRFGRMVVYMPALVIFTLCFGSYIFATTIFTLFLVRLSHGFAWGVTNTAAATIVSDIIPQNLRGRGIGYFGLSMTLGMAIGPSLGVLLLKHQFDMHGIFLLTAVLCFISFICSLFLRPPAVAKNDKPFNVKHLFEKRVMGIAGIEFFFGLVYASVMVFATLHGLELQIENMSIFFLIFAITTAATRPTGGRIMETKGPTPLLAMGLGAFAVGLIIIALAKNDTAFLVSSAFLGVGGGFIMPTIMTMAINIVAPQRRGAANATIFTAFDLGIGVGSMVFGVISHRLGYAGMYGVATAVVAIPAVMYFAKVRTTYKKMLRETANF